MFLLLLAQLAAASTDSTYSSAALRTLVSRAAIENHAPPPAFLGYRAHVESEMSLILRDTLGRERAGQVEQLASAVEWKRGSAYDMHIVGYRTQGLGSPVSTLSFVRGWTEPSLYGERLRLGVDVGGRAPISSSRDTIVAVHPFATDRDLYYTFSGGDTITVIRSGNRAITVVRVRVTPHLTGDTRLGAFDGEIDLDVDRQQIVRMRGRFVVIANRDSDRPLIAKLAGLTGVAYVEFVNTEVRGKYWLPASQRTELQSTMAVLGHVRAVVRIMSTFSDYSVDEDANATATFDDSRRLARHTTWARSDTVNAFGDWVASVGDMTTSVTANDFDDLAPDAWKTTGGVRLDLVPTNIDNVIRFDRIEGLYTGYQATVQMRSVVPGLSFGANGGWAWAEQTIRGGAHVTLQQKDWILGARAERTLTTTNDFVRPFDPQTGGLAAMIGSIDDFDYVDRRLALASATRIVGSVENAIVTTQIGVGDDRAEVSRLDRGWIGSGTFRPNRGVRGGTYSIAMIDAELHPGISGDFVQPGFGALAHYEVARGQLAWQRTELSVSAIRYWGPVAVRLQGDGGVVSGSTIPPQKLFEMGGSGVLPGYEYKEFAGDRAALFRGFGSYALPVWKTPHRLRNFFIPGAAPAFAVGIQGGWTEFSSSAARSAALGLNASPLPHATDGIRATLGLGMTFFSGAIHAGFARPVDRVAPWKFTIGGGPAF